MHKRLSNGAVRQWATGENKRIKTENHIDEKYICKGEVQ